MPVHFHSGTAEIEAEVRLFGASTLKPGATAYARIVLRRAWLLLLPGDRFDHPQRFRRSLQLAAEWVIDTGAPRYRKRDDIAARLDALASPDAALRIARLTAEAPYGVALAELVGRTGMTEGGQHHHAG